MFDDKNELLITRISHDLAGSIGAVANAVELLEEGDLDFIDNITSILKTSSFSLAARLKFFRLAFGIKNTNLENTDVVVKTIDDYLASHANKSFPIVLNYDVKDVENRKTSLLMIMLLTDIMIRGGVLSVWDQNKSLFAKAESQNKLADEKINKIIKIIDNGEKADAELVHALLLKNKNVSILHNENVVVLKTE